MEIEIVEGYEDFEEVVSSICELKPKLATSSFQLAAHMPLRVETKACIHSILAPGRIHDPGS